MLIKEIDLVYTDADWKDLGSLDYTNLTMGIGTDENEIEIFVDVSGAKIDDGALIYIEGTEWGGVVDRQTVDTETGEISYIGRTWSGILEYKIIVPPTDKDHLVVSGDAHAVLQLLIERLDLGDLFEADSRPSAITINNYQFPRFIEGYTGIRKMLLNENAKLKMRKEQKVILSAEPIVDYSDRLSFSDELVNFFVDQDNRPVNHLVCLGTGELQDRNVIDLYTDADGNISFEQTYYGIDEKAVIYDYNNADRDSLEEYGRDKLEGFQNETEIDISIEDAIYSDSSTVYDIDDIIGAYERFTGLEPSGHIIAKILRSDGKVHDIQHKVGETVGSLNENAETQVIVAGDGLYFIGNELNSNVTEEDLDGLTKTFRGTEFPTPPYTEGDRFINTETGLEYWAVQDRAEGETGDESDWELLTSGEHTYFAYSANADGSEMTEEPQDDSAYIGIAQGLERPDDYTQYTWSRFLGMPGSGVTVIVGNSAETIAVDENGRTLEQQDIRIPFAGYIDNARAEAIGEPPVTLPNGFILISITNSTTTTDGEIILRVNANNLLTGESNGEIPFTFYIEGIILTHIFSWSKSFSGLDGQPGDPGDDATNVLVGNEAFTVACDEDGLALATTQVQIPFSGWVGNVRTPATCDVGLLPSGMAVVTNTPSTAINNGLIVLSIAQGASLNNDINGQINLAFTCNGITIPHMTSWSKAIRGIDGDDGDPGDDGNDATSIIVGNESFTVACDTAGSTIDETVVDIPFYGVVGNNKAAASAAVGILPDGVTVTTNNAATPAQSGLLVLTVQEGTDLGTATGTNGDIPVLFTCNNLDFAYTISWSKALEGEPGENAVLFEIESNVDQVIILPDESTLPNTIVFQNYTGEGDTANRENYAGRVEVDASENGIDWTTVSRATSDASTYPVTMTEVFNAVPNANFVRSTLYASGG